MSKSLKTTALGPGAFKPSLANCLDSEIEAAFRCKAYLFASWEEFLEIAKAASDNSDEIVEQNAEKLFGNVRCAIDDILDNAISDAAQNAANRLRMAMQGDAT